ncbi:MAG: 3-hydroxyacyl-CoA dehydrogenase [Proteobacteria bacterium]|nr:3-hydroxyacyl-CoA dehydrogenase [Pseudomonadota bacterium]
MSLLTYRLDDGIAVIQPAQAASSADFLPELPALVQRAQGEAAAQAVVLAGVFGAWAAEPEPAALQRACESLQAPGKPVLGAVEGAVSGPALQLLLACRWCIGGPGSALGFPEVKSGLIPAPAVIEAALKRMGAQETIEALSGGNFLDAARAARAGLLDALGETGLEAALAFARNPEDGDQGPEDDAATRAAPPPDAAGYAALRGKVRARVRGQLAPLSVIDAVEALSSLPPAQARARVAALYAACREGEQHQALRHVAAAQRAAQTIPGLAPGEPLPIRTAAVIGAGTMGGGIAMSFANAGIPVTLLEVSGEALERGMALIRGNYEASVQRGSLAPARAAAALQRIRGATGYEALSAADIIVEAVFEDLEVKREVFARLDRVAAPQAILATNTSTLDIDAIAASTSRPQQVVGTHFFSPAHVMKLLENVRGRATSAQVIRTVMQLGQTLGKVTVLAGNADGFIGNRMLMFYGLEAEFLLEEGATPEQIDRVIEGFGFAMGPLAVRDLAGNDVGLLIRRSRTLPPDERWSPVLERLVAAGRLGQKAGKGFYRYEGRTRLPDPEVQALIESVSRELRIVRRPIADAEILDRLLHPLVNAGAQLVEEGIALRTGDVDIVYVNGYGFPAWRGGPMFWAERSGLERVVATAQTLARRHGARWGPSAYLVRAAARGGWGEA